MGLHLAAARRDMGGNCFKDALAVTITAASRQHGRYALRAIAGKYATFLGRHCTHPALLGFSGELLHYTRNSAAPGRKVAARIKRHCCSKVQAGGWGR
jgi:hypothetical protein